MSIIAQNNPFGFRNPVMWILANAFIAIFGVAFLNWNAASLATLFYFDLLLFGVIQALTIILTGIGSKRFFTLIFMKGFAMIFMVFLYTALIILTMVFSMNYLKNDDLTNAIAEDPNSLKFGLYAIVINHIVRFIMEFIVEKGYKTMEPMGILFKTFVYVMPVSFIIIFGVEQAVKLFSTEHSQLVAVSIIILSKTIVDIIFIKLKAYTSKLVLIGKNENFENKQESENE